MADQPETLDYAQLNRELDKTKAEVFLGKNAAFLGSLMCSMNFRWTEEIPTAATNGTEVLWNPHYFLRLPKGSRKTDLMHELWHAALLHMLRRGAREPRPWNIACDIKIDLMLEAEGYTFEEIKGVLTWTHIDARKYVGWAEEDIYDDLMKNNPPPQNPNQAPIKLDILDQDPAQKQQAINAVVQAVQAATLQGQAGSIPGAVKETLKDFLEPVVPWETLLMRFFTDLMDEDYSWARPNRRYTEMYLPSRVMDDGRLAHIICYQDVSGSISQADSIRFNSELKYIQTVLNPQRLTIVLFDTCITKVVELKEEDPFDFIEIIGRGGTSLVPVREHIEENEPTAAIIFSDMCVAPMAPLTKDIPVIWVAVGNRNATVPFGKLIHIRK